MKRTPLLLICSVAGILLAGGCAWVAGATDYAQGQRALDGGETTVAESYFAAAAQASSRNPDILGQIVQAYAGAGKREDAIRWMKLLVKAAPSTANRETLGLLEIREGHLTEGCSELASLAGNLLEDAMVTNNYAYACMAEPGKDLDRAISLLQGAVDRISRKAMVDDSLGWGFTQQASSKATIVDSLGWAYVQRYRLAHRPEDLLKGTALLEKAVVTEHTDDVRNEIRKHLIAAYSLSGRPEVVVRPLAPQWVIEDSLGAALASGERPGRRVTLDSAVALLEDAESQQPGDAPVRLHLGEAYRAEGRKQEAYVEIRKAYWLDPGLVEAGILLEKMRGAA